MYHSANHNMHAMGIIQSWELGSNAINIVCQICLSCRFSGAWQVMFWALFDQTNVEKFEGTHPKFNVTSNTGKFLFAIYLITAVLVGINMLIAMMNNSFEYFAVSAE